MNSDTDSEDSGSPFDTVSTKDAHIELLKRWRQAARVLHASRRFRYTLDLKKEEERNQRMAKIRAHAQVIRAALLFRAAVEGVSVPRTPNELPATPSRDGDFAMSQHELDLILREHDVCLLQQHGGVNGVAVKLRTYLEKGICGDETDILQRKNAFGSNAYPRKNCRSFWKILWDACKNRTLIILMGAAAVSLALGIKTQGLKEGWYEGGSIALAVISLVVTTAISDYNQSCKFESLNEEKQNLCLEVMRGGRRVPVSKSSIVVGDVIPLKIGNRVPADGLLIPGYSVAIDESNVTGEKEIIYKDANAPFLMSGDMVVDGYGTMLVTRVGTHTDWGSLMASTSEANGAETSLQVRLNGIATIIGRSGLVFALALLIVLMARYFTGNTKNPDGSIQFKAGHTSLGDAIHGAIKIFSLAITVVVVAASKGLPSFFTLMLSNSVKKMVAGMALVRRLSACETMGSATTIFSDTRTLTLNQMTVVEAYICGKKIDAPDNESPVPAGVMSLLIEGIAQNTTGSFYMLEGGRVAEVSGSPMEKAILQWGVNLGMDFDAIRSNTSIIHASPFSSGKKKGGIAVKLPNSRVNIHWKGDAEIVLASCTSYIDENGDMVPMDENKVSLLYKATEDMAAKGLRCIAFAYKSYEMEKVQTNEESVNWQLPEEDLVLIAVVGLKDPCRPGAREAVQLCIKSCVKVRMVTSDNLRTAKAIALECGILQSDSDATEPYVIEGKRFRGLSELEREAVAPQIAVMARSSPEDKHLLVKALRRSGDVVAVTGDSTDDAPALHEADIGLAMGISGTEVAKESSDIIILDDNFSSILTVVTWGRSVYANIQKFIQFQLTVNVAALIINMTAAISSGDPPLNAVQLLWVNLIMDTLGALALATEPPTEHLMHRPPVGRREPLISNAMWRNLIVQASYQVTVLLLLHFKGKSILNLKDDTPGYADIVKNTLIFNAFVLCQVFNEFNARKPDEINIFKGLHKNCLFMGTVVVILLREVSIIMFGGKFTSTVRLSWKLWLLSIAIGFISWPLAVIGKLIPVPQTPFAEFLIQKRHHRQNQRGFQLV